MRTPLIAATLALALAACTTPAPSTGSSSSSAAQSAAATSSASYADLIQVTAPTPNQTVASPLIITGRARGQWYFEASFPVALIDSTNTMIAEGIAEAQGDWMTTEFVPFTVTLTGFSATPGTSGYLILQKSNASGEPQNDASITVPVQF